jgi:hypothetical protein
MTTRSAAEGGGRRPAFTRLAKPYSATEVDGWNKLSRVSQNRAAVQGLAGADLRLLHRDLGLEVLHVGLGLTHCVPGSEWAGIEEAVCRRLKAPSRLALS